MEITSTVVTRTAIQETKTAVYRAEYIEENGKLYRVQCSVHKLPVGEETTGDYIGSVYLDRLMLSCSLPYDGDASKHFKAVTDMIATITETTPLYERNDDVQTQETNSNQR